MATSSPLSAVSPAYIAFLRETFDPDALDQSWRVLFEMLDEAEARPSPGPALLALFRRWTAARFAWVQEELENRGAWTWLDRQLDRLLEQAGAAAPHDAVLARTG